MELDTKNRGIKAGASLVILFVLALVALIVFRITFVNFVDNYELGYKFDARSGQVEILKQSGYVITPPFLVTVHTVDLRPMQVCINANARVLNCKLVKFNPDGLQKFLSWHGRANYNNNGIGDAPSNFNKIMMSYAFDGTGNTYPFLTILRELKPEDRPELEQEIKK